MNATQLTICADSGVVSSINSVPVFGVDISGWHYSQVVTLYLEDHRPGVLRALERVLAGEAVPALSSISITS